MSKKPKPPKPVTEKSGLHTEKQSSTMAGAGEARIIERLDRIAAGVDKLVEAIPKPASRARRLVEVIVTLVAIASIVGVIDIVRTWLGGWK